MGSKWIIFPGLSVSVITMVMSMPGSLPSPLAQFLLCVPARGSALCQYTHSPRATSVIAYTGSLLLAVIHNASSCFVLPVCCHSTHPAAAIVRAGRGND